MKEQNYRNHRQYLIGYHGITFILVFILFIASIYNLYISFKRNYDITTSIMFFITSLALTLLFFYSRAFALKAQDRAIRAEENFRFFILTGKGIDPKIKMSQLIALRFASDEELLELSKKAADESLSSDEIKKQIKNWKADRYRA